MGIEEDVAPRRRGLTRLDRWVVGAAFLILAGLLVPIYFNLREQAYFQSCQQNLKAIGQALTLYKEDFGRGLPSAHAFDPGTGEMIPQWYVAVSPYVRQSKVSNRSAFICPSADPATCTRIGGASGNATLLSYGFYVGLSAAQDTQITAPGNTVVLAETAVGPSAFDPLNALGTNAGYLIGYDDSDAMPTKASRYVTRLAIARINGAEGWVNSLNLWPRHGTRGLNALYEDGHVGVLDASTMILARDFEGKIMSPWSPAENTAASASRAAGP